MPTLLVRTYHGSKICTGNSFLLKIHITFYCQYAKFRNAAYEKVYLDLLQSFLQIKLKAHGQLSKNLCLQSPELTILNSRKNVSNMLYLIMKILIKKML